jgi:TonB family protein
MMQRDGMVVAVGAGSTFSPRDLRRIRGPLWGQTDPRIALVMIISVAVHFGVLVYIHRIKLPPPAPVALEKIPDRFVKFIVEKPLPKADKKPEKALISTKPEAAATTGAQASTADADKSAGNATPAVSAKDKARAQKAVAARVTRVEQKIRTVGVLGMLTGVGTTARGPAVVNVLGQATKGKEQFQDLEKALQNMNGIVKTQGGEMLDRKLVKSKDLTVNNPREEITSLMAGIGAAKTVELTKRGNFVIQRPEAIEGSASSNTKRDNDAINAVVSSHKASIRMSYEKFLQRDPTLAGKITVRFTIAAGGQVSRIEIVENTTGNPELEQDISKKIKMWEFEPIAEGDVTVTYPFVFSLS